MANDIKKIEAQFARSLGNGKTSCVALNSLVRAAIASGEEGPLHRAINAAVKRGDEQAANVVVSVVKRVFVGAKLKREKGKIVAGLNLGGSAMEVCDATVAALGSAAADELSIRGAAFKKRVLPNDKPKATFEERMAMLVAQGVKEGLSVSEMRAAFNAAAKK